MRAFGQRWIAALFVVGMAATAACAAASATDAGQAATTATGAGEAISPAAVDATLREADALKITDFARYSRLVDAMTPMEPRLDTDQRAMLHSCAGGAPPGWAITTPAAASWKRSSIPR